MGILSDAAVYTAVGAGVGLSAGLGTEKFMPSIRDNGGQHNGLIGDNWGFVATGAGAGGAIAAISAGISIKARKNLGKQASAMTKALV